MVDGNIRSARTLLTILAVVAASLTLATPAHAGEECYYDPGTGQLVCEDDGGGGGSDPGNDYWTSWRLIGPCGGGGAVGGIIVDITTGLIAALRDHIVDGEVVETQLTCIDLDDAQDEAWDALASAIAAIPDPRWEANPDGILSKGLTGLDTWLWYSNPTQVGPIDATWTEPITGLVFGVRGRGWAESITWDTGERTYDVFAAFWDDAPGMGGSHDTPAATHLYNTTSADAGHLHGYPVSLDLLWVGEYQVGTLGVWTGWSRFSSTLPESFPDIYEVVEVRSRLSG